MIEFPIGALRQVSKTTAREMAYLQDLFGNPLGGSIHITPGMVALVLNQALAVDLVRLPGPGGSPEGPKAEAKAEVAPEIVPEPPPKKVEVPEKAPVQSEKSTSPAKPRPLTVATSAILGPEHTVVTPLKTTTPKPGHPWVSDPGKRLPPVPRGRTLAQVDEEEIVAQRLGKDDKAAVMREIIHALQDMAVNEIMPSKNDWDLGKPAHLPIANTLLPRWGLSGWGELAQRAKLTYLGKGARRGGRQSTKEAIADETHTA